MSTTNNIKYSLYGLFDPQNGDLRYIGITKRSLGKRLGEHLRYPTNGRINSWFVKLSRLGNIPEIKLLKECSSYSDLLSEEIRYIKEERLTNPNLLNVSDGGDTSPMLGKKQSQEFKDYLREINMGERNPNYGKSPSKESIEARTKKVKENGTFKGENNPNFKFRIDGDELRRLFINENKTIKELSIMYSCSGGTIDKKLRQFNINKPKSNKYGLVIGDILEFREKGMTLKTIGEIYGCKGNKIHRWIKTHSNG